MQEQPGQTRFSKYSPRQSVYVGDKDYPAEEMSDPSGSLPKQSIYVVFNPRTHLVDHYIDNSPPDRIELKSWKMDFIAGELALDRMDLPEAKSMFEMALKEAEKSKTEETSEQKAFAKVRLAYIARKSSDAKQAVQLYKEALQELQAEKSKAFTRNEASAIDVAYRELALISWKEKNYAEAESYLRQRLSFAKTQCGEIGPAIIVEQNELANVLFYQKKFKEADQLYTRCFITAQRFKKDSDHTLQASWNLANCKLTEHQYADALELFQKLERCEKQIQQCQAELQQVPEPQRKAKGIPSATANPEVCKQLVDAAKICMNSNRSWDAKTLLQAAESEVAGSDFSDLKARIAIAKAELDLNQGDFSAAAKSCQSAIDISKDKKALKAERAFARAELLLCQIGNQDYAQLAQTYQSLQAEADQKTWEQLIAPIYEVFSNRRLYNIPEKALEILKSVCEQSVKSVPEKSTTQAKALFNLAHTYQLDRTKMDLAVSAYAQAIAAASAAKDRDESFIYKLESDLGMAYMANQQFKESQEQLSKALAYAEKNPGRENRQLRSSLSLMSALYNNWKQPEQEEAFYLRAMELNDSPPSFRARQRITDLINLSNMSTAYGDYKKTEQRLAQAISLGADSSQIQSITQGLLALYQRFGLYEKIADLYLTQAQTLNGRERLKCLYLAAESQFKSGNYSAAEKQIQEVIDAMEQTNETKDRDFGCYFEEPRYSKCLFLLGNCMLDGENNYDKAIVVFDRFAKAFEVGTVAPESRGRQIGPMSAAVRMPEVEELVNMLICCDAIGNKERASTFREQLKARLGQNQNSQQAAALNHQDYTRAIALIEKPKLSRNEEIALMEAVPKALHSPGTYSGISDGAELLERALILRKKNNAAAEINSDYQAVCGIYMNNRHFDAGEPAAYLYLQYLKQNKAGKQEIANAELNYGACLAERGYFTQAKKLLLDISKESAALTAAKQFQLYSKLAMCSKNLNENAEAIKYWQEALKYAPEGTQMHSEALAELKSLQQNVKKP